MPQLNIRIDQDLSERFHKMCAERDTTASDVLRAAITAFVERDMQTSRQAGAVATMRSPPRAIDDHPAVLQRGKQPSEPFNEWPPRAAYGSRLKKDKGSK